VQRLTCLVLEADPGVALRRYPFRRQVHRPDLQPEDRVVPAALSRRLPRARRSAFFVTPAALLRW
jgi:hypothetical protein